MVDVIDRNHMKREGVSQERRDDASLQKRTDFGTPFVSFRGLFASFQVLS